MEKEYLVSFGNSRQYLLRTDAKSETMENLRREVHDYLDQKFPEMRGIGFYDKISVKPIDKEEEAEYAGYPQFGPAAIEEIKRVLSVEVEDAASLRRLNSNAAFGS